MNRVYNFSAGPATLAEEVLTAARDELLSYQNTGLSVLEMSHRSQDFIAIVEHTEQLVRELLNVPDDYHVLFLQGGASSQFSMVPLNLLKKNKKADYVQTGLWSKKAVTEAKRYGRINLASNSEANKYTTLAPFAEWQCDETASYLHYTSNETVHGVQFREVPSTITPAPLVVDMSSDILAAPIDVSQFALIYAGAQKNIGPAGITLVIIKKELVGHALPSTPVLYDYQTHVSAPDRMYNTPPTFSLYMIKLALTWLKNLGGVTEIEKRNQYKATLLYQAIDNSEFYHNAIAPQCRSYMNVPFTLADTTLDQRFLIEAKEAGLVELKGHCSLGGMRASLYNAMPIAGITALVEFMRYFEKTKT